MSSLVGGLWNMDFDLNDSDYFNTGVMSLVPDKWIFNDMMSKIASYPSYDQGDQGFLNEYFKYSWHRLPYAYNAQQPDFISNPKQWNFGMLIIIE